MHYEEHRIQESFVLWMRNSYPDILLTCAPAVAKNVQQGVRNKRMGYQKGWPDIFIAKPANGYYGLFIEFKAESGSESKDQRAIREHLILLGYKSIVCRSVDDAISVVEKYLGKKP